MDDITSTLTSLTLNETNNVADINQATNSVPVLPTLKMDGCTFDLSGLDCSVDPKVVQLLQSIVTAFSGRLKSLEKDTELKLQASNDCIKNLTQENLNRKNELDETKKHINALTQSTNEQFKIKDEKIKCLEMENLNRKNELDETKNQINALTQSITEQFKERDEKIKCLEMVCEELARAVDKLEQYSRLETPEFHGIPPPSARNLYRNGRENTSETIVDFCRYHLNIEINKYDISISHRMPIQEEKRKYGEEYIPPIYCRFVNRSVAMLCMERKHLLKDAHNNRNGKYVIKQNLTLQRRLLRDRAEEKLHSYKFKWVKNGTVWVRKERNSKPIKVVSDEVLDDLIKNQDDPKSIRRKQNISMHPINQPRFRFDKNSENIASPISNSEFPPLPSVVPTSESMNFFFTNLPRQSYSTATF